MGIALGALAIGGCRSNILQDQHAVARPESGLAARVSVLQGTECPGQASAVSSPEQCLWPNAERRSMLMSAVVQVVAHVGADGRADGVRVVNAPAEFNDAAVECALRTEYRAQVDENGAAVAGETCPIVFKFARYASDVARRDNPPIHCPPGRSGALSLGYYTPTDYAGWQSSTECNAPQP
jgi:hypothetical protein